MIEDIPMQCSEELVHSYLYLIVGHIEQWVGADKPLIELVGSIQEVINAMVVCL